MQNQYPLWKYILIVVVLIAGAIYALPNLYGDDPAVQISPRHALADNAIKEKVENGLKEVMLKPKLVSLEQGKVLVRFDNQKQQLDAQKKLTKLMGDGFIIALNLAPATPDWLKSLNALPMYLGLDLRGGVHFLLQVDMKSAISQSLGRYVGDFKTFLRSKKIRYRSVLIQNESIEILLSKKVNPDEALEYLQQEYSELKFAVRQQNKTNAIFANLTPVTIKSEQKSAIEQNIITLKNRVNELGVAEPIVQRQGSDNIVVQLPGVQDTAKAKQILGATATLEFRLTHGSYTDWSAASDSGRVPVNARLFKQRSGDPVLLKRQVIVTGDQIKNAAAGFDGESGTPAVFVDLDGKGAKRMQKITAANLKKQMSVVFIENRTTTKYVGDKPIKTTKKVSEVINIATIQDVLSHRFQITGLDVMEARDLALLLRAGALKAPVEIVEERTVGPSLGQDNINQGIMSVQIGMALVFIFMLVYYRLFGLFANIALVTNIALIVALLSLIQATLTLPGIAGIVLTVGMAVDANVLIFERIKEELRNGMSHQAAIKSGYEKAFTTIADANITTLIAAVVLFSFGTGPIKGFAITLSLGIITSMFTAIMGTRAIANLVYGGKNIKKISI
ncbi:MAG: protein translocase subunit SecD [Gammaproteobacteria bacterium]|nr:MAG: protein translocase subunit SecD [Gammaproteobacteria bacterium]